MALKEYKIYEADRRLLRMVIANSTTLPIGAPVVTRTGNATVVIGVARGGALGGVCVGLEDKNGNSVFGSLAKLGGATVSGQPDSGSITTGSANTTTDLIVAVIDISKSTIFSASITGTMNSTATSNTAGGWIDLSASDNSGVIDETTHTRTITTGGQFKTWGVDPNDSTRILVSLANSEFWDYPITLA